MAEDYMFGETIHAFASFPVTQQAIGIFAMVAGLIITIRSVAKRIFHGLQKSVVERQLKNELAKGSELDSKKTSSLKLRFTKSLPGRIKDDNVSIGTGIFVLTLGLLTVIPVAGSVLNGVFWYKEVQAKKEALRGPVYA